jgi:hypothetical protein
MTKFKLLTAGLMAAAMLASPAMAREYHPSAQAYDAYASTDSYPDAAGVYGSTDGGYANAYAGYAGAPYDAPYLGGRTCRPAPRVGAFAGQPWDNNVPCEPSPAY